MKDPMNVGAVNLRNVDRKKSERKNTRSKSKVESVSYRINHLSILVNFGGSECSCRIIRQK